MTPKFRAFIKAKTETVYGGLAYSDDCVLPVGLIDFTDGEVTVWGCGREDCGLCGDDFSLDDIVLMQSTGLKDKNGMEIYEGDVIGELSEQGEDWEKHIIAEVVWHKAGFYGKEKGHEPEYPITEFAKGEVIGNIYTNPELLEVVE